jgi:hypothetical protein
MVGFLILLFIMVGVWLLLLTIADTAEISRNWPKYRCQASVIPFAAFYGHDTTENFQYCMTQIMNDEAGSALSPVFQILAGFLATLGTLMKTANSLRVEFATMMGGINTMFQNFADRFRQLQLKVKTTGLRMQMLMQRLYATFFAVIFIALSSTTALQNFSNTVLFRFLDTFCFDPDTVVEVKGKGKIAVKDVQLADILEPSGSEVTAVFSFLADGQPMVELPGPIIVSTNHYLFKNDTEVLRADSHPDAKPSDPWAGGVERPLICFNTSNHIIPIGSYRFLDYDETEAADADTMAWIDRHLNAVKTEKPYNFAYTTLVDPNIRIQMKQGNLRKLADIDLGDEIKHGKVIGIVEKKVTEVCLLPSGEHVTPGQLYWDSVSLKWRRASHTTNSFTLKKPIYYRSLFVSSSAIFETEKGTILRDYLEIHSPDSEQFYAKHLEESTLSVFPSKSGMATHMASCATTE